MIGNPCLLLSAIFLCATVVLAALPSAGDPTPPSSCTTGRSTLENGRALLQTQAKQSAGRAPSLDFFEEDSVQLFPTEFGSLVQQVAGEVVGKGPEKDEENNREEDPHDQGHEKEEETKQELKKTGKKEDDKEQQEEKEAEKEVESEAEPEEQTNRDNKQQGREERTWQKKEKVKQVPKSAKGAERVEDSSAESDQISVEAPIGQDESSGEVQAATSAPEVEQEQVPEQSTQKTGDVEASAPETVQERAADQAESGSFGDADPAPASPSSHGEHCTPTCMWSCESPKCDQVCEPICQAPKCETRCAGVSTKGCSMECSKPHCAVMCPKSLCATEDCPSCKTKCSEPQCKLHCPQTQSCENICEQPQCEYKCKAPLDCPKPKCKMVCERSKKCQMSNSFTESLPPLEAGQISVQSFAAPSAHSSGTARDNQEHELTSQLVDVHVASVAHPALPQYRVVSLPVLPQRSLAQTESPGWEEPPARNEAPSHLVYGWA